MRLYIEPSEHPWVTWDKELWRAAQSLPASAMFTIVPNFVDCDMVLVTPHHLNKYIDFLGDRELILYAESLDDFEENRPSSVNPNLIKMNLTVLSPDDAMLNKFIPTATPCYKWITPSRVPELFTMDIPEKTGGFVITCNGSNEETNNLASVLRTYFAMCLDNDPENEGELRCMQDVDIFSAQELPFETFNNVRFNGLQPNIKMFKTIRAAKLFISPYSGNGVQINAVDSIMLGTPALVRDTPRNRERFLNDERVLYADEAQLARNIKYFSEIPATDSEYVDLTLAGRTKMLHMSPANCLENLIYVLRGGAEYA